MESPRWKLVYFVRQDGKLTRNEKLLTDPKKGQAMVTKLQDRDVAAHVVCRRFPKFPPKGTPDDDDKLWCPYCRQWRYFAVPRKREPFTRLEIRCCKWCRISEDDAYVKNYNGTWEGRRNRRRKGKKKRKK